MATARGDTQADKAQNARDLVARRMNVAAGNGMSTAWPNAQAAQQSNVPVPTARPSNVQQSIDDQVSEVPVPTARPNPAAVAGGDASVLEAMQGVPQTAVAAAPQSAPAQQQGDAQVAEQMSPRPVQGPPVPNATSQSGVDGNAIAAVVAALGGAAGVAALIQRARMGDADAARTFEAIGMHPEDLAMFADEPLNQRSGRYDYSEQSGGQDASGEQKASAKGDRPSKAQPTDKSGAPLTAPMPPWFEKLTKADVPKVKVKAK